MPNVVIIEKSGNLKTIQLKDFSIKTISKKAGIKSLEGFELQHTWGSDDGIDENISLYAKTEGRAGQENKYDFPPPVDDKLFFGSCVLLGRNQETGEPVDLKEDDWEEIVEFLFGGFDEIGSDDSDDESDVDTEDELDALKATGLPVATTKQGYVKDGFIAESDEEEEVESEEESEEESDNSEEEIRPNKKTPVKAQPKKTPVAKKKSMSVVVPKAEPILLDDCGDELSVESYDE
jgi:hypothetical protein